jgi:hypothetical protein
VTAVAARREVVRQLQHLGLHGLGALGPYRLASASRRYCRTVLREQPSCFAIDLAPSPLGAIARISTTCSWGNIDGSGKAAILSQVGHFYSVGVGQFHSVVNNYPEASKAMVGWAHRLCMRPLVPVWNLIR